MGVFGTLSYKLNYKSTAIWDTYIETCQISTYHCKILPQLVSEVKLTKLDNNTIVMQM